MLKKIMALCLSFMLIAASALASDLEVLSERMYVITCDHPRVYYFRVVRNKGNSPIKPSMLELDILDRDGKVMEHDQLYCSHYTLAPGQLSCYSSDYLLYNKLDDYIKQGRYPGGFKASCDAEPTDYLSDTITLPTSCAWDMRRREGDSYYIDVTFENYIHATTDIGYVEIYMMDDAGHIILADYDLLFDRVPGYQTQVFRYTFEESLINAVLENNPSIGGVYSLVYTD